MPRKIFTAVGELYFVPEGGIVDLANPTVSEISAGIRLTDQLQRDGISDRGGEAAIVDASDAGSDWDKTEIGTSGGNLELGFWKQFPKSTDLAWNTLQRGTRGTIVIAPGGFSGVGDPPAPVAGDDCETWSIAVSSCRNNAIGANDLQSFKVTCAVPEEPEENATVS